MRQLCEILRQDYFLRLSEFPPQCELFRIYLSFRFHVKSNFGESISSKTAVYANFGVLNFLHFSLQKVEKVIKIKIQTL